MEKKFIFLSFYSLLILISAANAQKNLVHVNPLTGTANAVIPLYTLNAAGVSLPIDLVYSATGVKTLDVEATAGMGWNIAAGGSIKRQVRGLPDDVKTNLAGTSSVGLMYLPSPSTIGTIPISNDNITTTYLDVQNDMQKIGNYFGYSDTEPDMFFVNAPGLSCQLVFDAVNQIFRPIPYQDLKITYTTNPYTGPNFGEITSFTITNDKGIVYTFSSPEVAMEKVMPPAPPASGVNYFKTTYYQYLNGISYYSGWDLTSIHDYYGNGIQVAYTTGTKKGFHSAMDVTVATPTNPAADSLQYNLYGYNIPNLISTINFTDGNGGNGTVFTFNWQTNSMTNKDVISSISGLGRLFIFSYNYEAFGTGTFKRFFLSNLTDPDCSAPFNYSFSYSGETTYNGSLITNCPDSTGAAQATDLWGYKNQAVNSLSYPGIAINPSTTGYDRYLNHGTETPPGSIYPYIMTGANMSANGYNVAGALTQINYGDGGYTQLSYQPNDYYDYNLAANVMAGGIRVFTITDYDGINSANNIVRSYSYYQNGGSFDDGLPSNGKAISLPVYAFTKPYNGTGTTQNLWMYSTVRTSQDLSTEDHTILYSSVKEMQTGKGSTVYQYLVPATHWDMNVTSPLTWSPTLIYAGSIGPGATGFLNNTQNAYPFAPNINYDFERGLLSKITNYNETGGEVNEENYTYSTVQTPINIAGFKYDQNSYGTGYAKYNIYTTAGPLVTQVVKTLFDLGSTNLSKQTTVNYTYNNTQYKLAQQSVTNSDGSIENSYTVYAKDYNTAVRNDSFTQCLYGLQQANINAQVETYLQVKPAGGSQFLTTRADLVEFCNTCTSYTSAILPFRKLKLFSADGVSSFTKASTATGSFVYDNADYTVTENDDGYDYTGNIMAFDDNYKHFQTIITDHHSYKPTYVFKNANWNEVSYQDFDSKLIGSTWGGPGETVVTTSRSGQFGASLTATNTQQSPQITKNAAAQNYIFSIWVQCAVAGGGSITVTATSGSVSNSKTFTYDYTTGNPAKYPTGWQYCEVKVPMTNIASTFTLSFSSNQNIIIDDILAYPDVAEATTFAYDPLTFMKTAQTNTNGVATYYNYDQFGRLRYAYDQDKNIVLRNQYGSATNAANFIAPPILGPSSAYNHISGVWSIAQPNYNSCVLSYGVTYTWDFGDGSTPFVTSTNYSVSHSYLLNGPYTLKLTVYSPFYGNRVSTYNITVSNLPAVNISYSNSTNGSSIGTVTFKQGTTTMYTFTTTQLASGVSVVPGAYTIVIHPIGGLYNGGTGAGYSSVAFTANIDDIYQCFSYTGSDFTFTADLTYEPTANFNMLKTVCGGGGM